MSRRTSVLVLVAGLTVALAAGGGIAAWASWGVGSSVTPLTAASARIPTMSPPRAELSHGVPEIEWTGVQLSGGRPVGGYVITRQDGPDRVVACAVAAAVSKCRDNAATPGGTVTYVVHATVGANWVGRDSEPSDPVRVPTPTTLASSNRKEVAPSPSPAPVESKAPDKSPKPSQSASESASPSPSASSSATGETVVPTPTDSRSQE